MTLNFASAVVLIITHLIGAALSGNMNKDEPYFFNGDKCNPRDPLIREIRRYEAIANKIIQVATNGTFKGKTYADLAYFVDHFGPRMTGTKVLEDSIDYMIGQMVKSGFERVHGEALTVPHWERGKEHAQLVQPRKQKLFILGLGNSVGTPKDGITAPVLVVNSFDELKSLQHQVPGKIVVFNQNFSVYDESVQYRHRGASEAAKFGAVAALIRSLTDFSMRTPHTGAQIYETGVPQIPAASIATEDAEMLKRMQDRGNELVVHLYMEAKTLPDAVSRNLIGEVRGRKKPHEVVILSGHIDTWDVGQGALDDGGGMMISYEAVALLRHLGLRPRRTIRNILFTAEEPGPIGSVIYINKHRQELKKYSVMLNSDYGMGAPIGLSLFGDKERAACIIKEALNLLKPINATTLIMVPQGTISGDAGVFYSRGHGIAAMELTTLNNERSLWYHHTEADMMSPWHPNDLDKCTAAWAVLSYVFADISSKLPRN